MIELPSLPPPPADAAAFQPFWEAIGREELALPHCPECGRWVWYPSDRCPGCGRLGPEWTRLAGRGTLFTHTVVHRSFLPGADRGDPPYVVGLIEPDEAAGVRLVGMVSGCAPAAVKIGMRLEVRFLEVAERRLPVWVPEEAAR
jgi:uncharacterized OB-fold protein